MATEPNYKDLADEELAKYRNEDGKFNVSCGWWLNLLEKARAREDTLEARVAELEEELRVSVSLL